jgi:hypothetical protein
MLLRFPVNQTIKGYLIRITLPFLLDLANRDKENYDILGESLYETSENL